MGEGVGNQIPLEYYPLCKTWQLSFQGFPGSVHMCSKCTLILFIYCTAWAVGTAGKCPEKKKKQHTGRINIQVIIG